MKALDKAQAFIQSKGYTGVFLFSDLRYLDQLQNETTRKFEMMLLREAVEVQNAELLTEEQVEDIEEQYDDLSLSEMLNDFIAYGKDEGSSITNEEMVNALNTGTALVVNREALDEVEILFNIFEIELSEGLEPDAEGMFNVTLPEADLLHVQELLSNYFNKDVETEEV